MNNDCIFCKILNKEIPSYKIYENDYVYSFLDICKDVEGHILVIPKYHCTNILDCPDKYLEETIKATKIISNHLVNIGYSGVNIINASGKSAQQTVFHLHFHIIPRKENDEIDAWPFKHINKNMDLNQIHKLLEIKK